MCGKCRRNLCQVLPGVEAAKVTVGSVGEKSSLQFQTAALDHVLDSLVFRLYGIAPYGIAAMNNALQ